jgi:hypothetical protein
MTYETPDEVQFRTKQWEERMSNLRPLASDMKSEGKLIIHHAAAHVPLQDEVFSLFDDVGLTCPFCLSQRICWPLWN